MKKILLVFISILLVSLFVGCDNKNKPLQPPTSKYKITIYSANGQEIQTWESYDYPYANEGFLYFKDGDNKVIRLQGTVIVREK